MHVQAKIEWRLTVMFYKGPDDVGTGGNIMLDRLMGAKVLLAKFAKEGKSALVWQRLLDQYSTKLRYSSSHFAGSMYSLSYYRKEGMQPYLLTAGGANTTGCWGYIEAWREMMAQVYRIVIAGAFLL